MAMHSRITIVGIAATAVVAAALISNPARAELSSEELAKLAQNPVANLVSVPFQNNTDLNYGPLNKSQNILNIQPVIPFQGSRGWNPITRTIGPVISRPGLVPGRWPHQRDRRNPTLRLPLAFHC